ncbi:hypothetical protein C1A50_3159 [Paenibacillus polymyxa]|nr:hypothetical protein C1A50_3159 [Paenibacillus polymyxa]
MGGSLTMKLKSRFNNLCIDKISILFHNILMKMIIIIIL